MVTVLISLYRYTDDTDATLILMVVAIIDDGDQNDAVDETKHIHPQTIHSLTFNPCWTQ